MARLCDIDGCERKHEARGYCKHHWKQRYGKPVRYTITCETCGAEHQSARKDGRFCSDACKGVHYAVTYRKPRELVHVGPAYPITWLPPQHPVMRRPAVRKPYLFYVGTCAWCGDGFTDLQPSARYCSPRCNQRAGGNRARKRKGYPKLCITLVERVGIYERDQWTCQLCLEPVDPDLMTTAPNDDWAPSLDHITTRVSGGGDEPANLRLAHRWCNSVRSDEQHYNESDLRISRAA